MSHEDNRQNAFAKAKQAGLEVKFPLPHELFIDIDSDVAFEECRKRLKQYKKLHGITQACYSRSKSGNYHVYVLLANEIHDADRIALQACFGSDPNRETLSMASVFEGVSNPTVFFAVPKNPKIPMEI